MSEIERKRWKMEEVVENDFSEWMDLKEELHGANRLRTFHDGEIWWCAMGRNLGVEINGKHETFSRPVLVLKKLSRFGFMGIPLTSQSHEGDWYVTFVFGGKREIAVLAQARVMSVARLYSKMGDATNGDLKRVKDGFGKLYLDLE